MGEKIGYAMVYAWIKVHALLPLPVLYVVSDILYFIIYRVVRYRVKVVRRNMKNAFPEQSEKERRGMEKEFFRHFADYIIETIKLAHISEKEVRRRALLVNPELIDRLIAEGHTCLVLLMGHYGNWEWYTHSSSTFAEARLYQIYRPLNSKIFDKLFIRLRTRFGAQGIKKNNTIRDMINLKNNRTPAVVIFLADQTPSKGNIHYWTEFLNQETPMFSGPERIARKLDLPVIYSDIKKIKRGYYSVEFEVLTTTPKETPEFWITEQYARKMEKSILRAPAYWLWSHKRWKHKRSDIEKK
ncbi:lysophospholipid acyltransferase family protein [Parabacteroides sp. PF5-6]|uniref:lysophospholipid acyltransferase family protein n=1 Tax=Parabacteroides sp. PF5-6 TaxID=1742403 RepID=UPI0024077332|nr:lysophospholipid acyltransferase family protein [Parabacteroides sp. PF5-6]MDF9828868.1 KDO2-lipid IV(A) lauroyltransferase [Parabacteroides sp. PF5-6]